MLTEVPPWETTPLAAPGRTSIWLQPFDDRTLWQARCESCGWQSDPVASVQRTREAAWRHAGDCRG